MPDHCVRHGSSPLSCSAGPPDLRSVPTAPARAQGPVLGASYRPAGEGGAAGSPGRQTLGTWPGHRLGQPSGHWGFDGRLAAQAIPPTTSATPSTPTHAGTLDEPVQVRAPRLGSVDPTVQRAGPETPRRGHRHRSPSWRGTPQQGRASASATSLARPGGHPAGIPVRTTMGPRPASGHHPAGRVARSRPPSATTESPATPRSHRDRPRTSSAGCRRRRRRDHHDLAGCPFSMTLAPR